jgi:nucleotide-binding universal stress UspA family protein
MKTIIVPTDFSAPAEKAMLYAGQLAKSIDASILLLHVYQIPVGMNDMPVLMVSADELKNNAEAGLNRAKDSLQKHYGLVNVETESRLGDVVDELNDLCEKINPLLIIVGKHGASGVERILFGSTSLSIIRHTNFPVLVVPDQAQSTGVKKTVLAVDASAEHFPAEKIKSAVSALRTQLHLIHVQAEKSASLDLKKLKTGLNATYSTVYSSEFVEGIETYIREHNIDLLIVIPHKHNLVERLFFKTHTPELLKKISIPILCINES